MAVLLRETNQSLWAIEPLKETMDLKPFLRDLYGYARHFKVGELCRDAGLGRNTVWRIFKRGHDMRMSTFIKLLYYMGLRLRLEVDPVPRRLNYGDDKNLQVDRVGAWSMR